ncbi:ATP-binding protein [Anoxynatronum buryatiense]|uniref:GHKL domain-containing protein n=1 Tax=Anoxynatronum buryatiense TaxID=489973 RepID=A0AA45WZK3_9CLOT|nr:GHKL domain-containing protein [Anoxynatronum buryatiense]SMP71699.1 GHKL domain-containing protein [Anoxynatronum buryatiense]
MVKRPFPLEKPLLWLLTLLLSSALFVTLYRVDNKYTTTAPQAINGVLYVSENDWTDTPIRYLRDGWRYYPDRLLTPESLPLQGDSYFHLSIGEKTTFALGSPHRSPRGSGSYAMTLHLPETVQTYALELPEVYAAYRFYVNDQLRLTMGQPDPEVYEDQTQCRIITFEASGKVTLLLAATNHSWIYSGLVYPPAFGDPLHVTTLRGLRFGLSLILMTVMGLLAAFSLYLAVRIRRRNHVWLFFMLCLATAMLTSYPVVHGILPLPVQPWYTLELVSGYLVTLLVILLHNRICQTGSRARLVSSWAAGLVCVLALVYGLGASYLSLPLMQGFSGLVQAFKWLTAGYLLFTAALAVGRQTKSASVLFYADSFYASALIWDRLLPHYEPIVGGWFQEWGSLSLVLAIGVVMGYEVMMGYRHSLVYAEEQRQMKRQLAMQVAHLQQVNQKVEESARLRHDFRHHLRTLMTLAREGHSHALESYLQGITEVSEGIHIDRLTENIELDALVQYYRHLAQSAGIQFQSRLSLPAVLTFPIVDLCGLLGNLLENAVEACQRQQTGDKIIFIAGRIRDQQLELVVDNTFEGEIRTFGGKYLSSKRNEVGLGIASVLETVERYAGVINLYTDEKGFHAELSLPLNVESPQ